MVLGALDVRFTFWLELIVLPVKASGVLEKISAKQSVRLMMRTEVTAIEQRRGDIVGQLLWFGLPLS